MSIPPLVCSTPPPPDQCEDDKDPGDFDISYSLSQEDDDDDENIDYNYGNFSSYNHYQSDNKPLEIRDPEITKSIDTGVHKDLPTEYENSKETEQRSVSHDEFETNDINENKLKCEEDTNIEDLNLKLNEDIVTNIVENSDENESSDQNTDSFKDLNIPCNSNNSSQDDSTNTSPFENVIDPTVALKQLHVDSDEAIVEQSINVNAKHETNAEDLDLSDLKEEDDESSIVISEPTVQECSSQNSNDFPEIVQQPLEEGQECSLQSSNNFPENVKQPLKEFDIQTNENVANDFGDFDDFQFADTKSNITSVVDSFNPWENNDTNEMEFGNFTANFEEIKMHTQDSPQLETRAISNNYQIEDQVKEEDNSFDDDDDDFGDFDDFKSSAAKTESTEVQEEDECQELSVLNLQSTDNEHHIMESITKVLTSVFIEEISKPDVEYEGKLESFLSETWGHLMETDERQPYIVNWNNSLGQKTLLRALCIDSRNILFGPKWSSHMPKYAANLSVAPLQPQKQTTGLSNVSQSEPVADKIASKPTTWSDPFTSDGQESCNTEHESTTITPRPTDLDVFEAAMSTKSEKIYSSTLGVQPIRQINLPDTHIFTPTDSEIPRSKTIHYDLGPTVLLPQPVVSDVKNSTDNTLTLNTNSVVEANTDDNEYWEFQDFKSTSNSSFLPGLASQPKTPEENNLETATTVNALPKPSIAYQTQLLQPIKIESSMPTLNWPDPGEVKAAYDDFTDFVSTTQSFEKQDSATMEHPESERKNNVIKSEYLNDLKETKELAKSAENDGFDDDFDTFQSAMPSKGAQNDFKTNTFENPITQMPLAQPTDFDYASAKSNYTKSDSISFTPMPRPNEALTQTVSYNSNTAELASKSSLSSNTPIQTSLLQPTPAGFSTLNTQNQRTPGQILQPLSLESYSQINWPSPGIDLQDLSRFNPVETLQSLKSDLSVSGLSKGASPVHSQKNSVANHSADDDVWGEFVSSKPKQQASQLKKPPVFAEDDEWSDFISSPNVKPQNGLNTISFNVYTNSNIQKTGQNKSLKNNQTPVDIPTLNYITPKSNSHKTFNNNKHFQNL